MTNLPGPAPAPRVPQVDADAFAPRLVAWQRTHGRHHLPWQQTTDAYRIWLSEIMLQQTQVLTVLPYYERFVGRFPNVEALAAASSDEVMAHWSGLGYYSRARNLHRCAQIVMAQYGGRFPADPGALAALPGIGRSTAAAIAAFGFGVRAAILDGNVKRVLTRVFGIEGFPGDRAVETSLWTLAERLLPAGHGAIEAYTQGLMDLGATVCVRGRPKCGACPFDADCVAHVTGREDVLPTARPRKPLPTRRVSMLVLQDGDRVLLEKRPPTGIWGGLWSLPEAVDAPALAQRAHGLGASGPLTAASRLTHTFTHFRLEIEAHAGHAAAGTSIAVEKLGEGYAWVPLARLDAYGLPAPVRRVLAALQGPLL